MISVEIVDNEYAAAALDKDGLWLISACGNMYLHHASHQVLVQCLASVIFTWDWVYMWTWDVEMLTMLTIWLHVYIGALPCKPWMLCVFVPWSPSTVLMANVTLVAGVIDTWIHSYVQHENRSLILSLMLICLAIINVDSNCNHELIVTCCNFIPYKHNSVFILLYAPLLKSHSLGNVALKSSFLHISMAFHPWLVLLPSALVRGN